MASQYPEVEQCKNVEFVGYHDLDDKPGFKLAIQVVDERWYLYVAHLWEPGLSILDVTDPSRPELLKFLEGPENTWTIQVQVADGKMITGLEKIGDGMPDERCTFWGHDPAKPYDEGILIWDVADPTDPKLLGQFNTDGFGTHRNYYAGGDLVHLCANMKGYKGNIYVIVDISNPREPVEVGRWWYPGQWVGGGEKPTEPYYFHGPATVIDELAYLSYGRCGGMVVDISNPAKPKTVSQLPIGGFGSLVGVHTFLPLADDRNLAIVTTEAILEHGQDNALFVAMADISDPAQPRFISLFPQVVPEPGLGYSNFAQRGGKFGPHNVHHPQFSPYLAPVEDIVHLCYFNAGLRIVDISDPLLPREVGYFVPEDPKVRKGLLPTELAPQFEDVLVDKRGNAYVSDKNHGLFILKYAP